MRFLVDTHVLLWWFIDADRIKAASREAMTNHRNTVYYSPVSIWEISIKYGLGKLKLGDYKPESLYQEISESFLERLEPSDSLIASSYNLPRYHGDPFDRLLIWQAIESDIVLISRDGRFHDYEQEGLKMMRESR